LRLYTRSWLTSKDQLQAIGEARQGRFDIEIKYNGEQLGLPYQALQGGYGSYSYEDYLDLPAPYRIIWQVRANGTHRFWVWADTEFIRRTVQTFRMGNARGFTLEPPIAYFTPRAAAYYKKPEDAGVYQYVWQKDWMWYLTWGRLAYNPDLPVETLQAAYREHYGPSGPAIYAAMQASGPIVPLALAYRFQGPDHRDHSPETETGALSYRKSKGTGSLTPLTFGENTPMDHRSYVGIDEFVRRRIDGKADGRIGPDVVAADFAEDADNTRATVNRVEEPTGRAGEEWRLLKVDLLSASHLADYYADRIWGVMRLDYALRTGTEEEYDKAVDDLARSRQDWKTLADTADSVYAPLLNKLRGQVDYQWSSQLEPLETLDKTVPDLWAARKPQAPAGPLTFPPLYHGAGVMDIHDKLPRAGAVTITGQVSRPRTTKALVVWSKPLPSEAKWTSQIVPFADDGRWSVDLPITPQGLLYSVEVQDMDGSAMNFPDVRTGTPYIAITPAEMQAGVALTH
ncbi:MAG: hypothetical protein M3Y56_14595, partial [Armatimonadota bacterium]|nr:hypothetical protein [Armatimonadota bacterium]